MAGACIRFGSFELDELRLELRRNGELVRIAPKPLALLLYLVRRPGQTIPREELLRELWPAVKVEDGALKSTVHAARRALDAANAGLPAGERVKWIVGVHGSGYRFAGSVECVQGSDGMAPAPSSLGDRGVYGAPRGRSRTFVGRYKEFKQLEDLLTPEASALQVSIEGPAGMGKTELALQLVHRLAAENAFPGGIFWLTAEEPDLRPAWAGTIADQMGVHKGSVEERCATVVRRLERQEAPILVVLDNVCSWSGSERPGPLPTGPRVHWLVSTQVRNFGGAQFDHVDVGRIEPPCDRELITALAGRDPGAGFEALLKHLAGHTLGLELAGTFLRTYAGETADSYLRALLQNAEQVESTVTDRVRYESTVTGSLQTVWERLSPAARESWLLAACFEPEAVSRELAEAAGLDPTRRRALEELHLIRPAGGDGWIMHRLVRNFGRTAGSEAAGRKARSRLVVGCLVLLGGSTHTALECYLRDRVHLDALVSQAPSLVSLEEELRLLRAIAAPTMAVAGYSSERIACLFQRLHELGTAALDPDAQLAALQGLYMNRMCRGAWRETAEIVARMREVPNVDDIPAHAMIRTYSGITLLHTGSLSAGDAELSDALPTGPLHTVRPAFSTVAILQRALAKCVLGFPAQALRLANESFGHAQKQIQAREIILMVIHKAFLHQLRGEVEDVDRNARAALDMVASERTRSDRAFDEAFAEFDVIGRILLLWVACVRRHGDDLQGALQILRYDRDSMPVYRPFNLIVVTGLFIRVGDRARAVNYWREAMDLMEASGGRLNEAELWRLRAHLGGNVEEQIQYLERALSIARDQEASWWELRASTDLVRITRGSAAAIERLRGVYGRLTEGFELPDVVRARRLLGG